MNYLTLCQTLRREAGVSGSGPTTVVGQTSIYADLVAWVTRAWVDIQQMQSNWLFMHATGTFNTIAAQRDYTAAGAGISDLALWDVNSFLIYKNVTGESDQNELPYMRYATWRSLYRARMNDRPNERPNTFTILPDNSIRFEPRPNDVYTMDFEYKTIAQNLAANDDVPTGLPDDFHMMIVWKALMYYADDQNAPDAMNKAIEGFNLLLHRLELEQLPDFNDDFLPLA